MPAASYERPSAGRTEDLVDGDRGAQASVIILTAGREREELPPGTLSAARRGDHHAFGILVEHFDDGLRRLAFHLLGSREPMDDVLQEAYLSAYRGLPQFRGESRVGTWLYRIVYTSCLQRLRRKERFEVTEDCELEALAAPEPDPADEVAQRDEMHRALAALSPEQCAAVLLIHRDGFSYADTAEILGVPVGTVASRVAVARKVLDKSLNMARSAEGGP